MTSLLEPLLDALKASDWSVFFVVVAIAVIINMRSLSEYFEERATRHQRFVQEALKLEAINPSSRAFLEEELNYFIFKRITGISADAILRDKLQDVISRSGGELQIRQISKAREFIRMKDGRLEIGITTFDQIFAIFNLIIGVLVALISLAMFMLTGLVRSTSPTQALAAAALGALLFAFAMFMASQAFPALVASRLATIVKRLEAPRADA